MADALLPPFALAAGVMLLAGVAKLRAPAATQRALAGLGLPPARSLASAIGAAEASIGSICLLAPFVVARIALAAAYLGLAGVTAARRLGGDREAPCGCFGDASRSTHLGHVVANLLFAAIAAAATAIAPIGLPEALADGPAGFVLLAGIVCSVYLAVAILALLPESWRAYGGDHA
jgi:hypothetical protein